VAIVAAVGPGLCGFTTVRMDGAQLSATPTRVPTLVILEPPSARADRDVDVLVYLFALDEAFQPRRGNAPQFLPDAGAVAGVETMGPGVWRGRWRVPAGESSAVGIAATFGQDATATAALIRNAGPPVTVEVVRDDEAAGGAVTGNPTAVLVRVRDAAGNLTDGNVEVEADAAQVGEPERVERGIYRAALVIPPGARADAVVIVARADRAVGTATLPIAPSAAAAVKITPPPPVRADGTNRAQIEVTVVDAFNNPVNEVPTATAARGDFGPAYGISPGQWILPYRPPRVSADTTEEILVRVGGASAKVELELTAPRLSFALGAKGGVAYGGSAVGPAAGVEAGLWSVFGRTQLGLVLDVDWWMRSVTSTATVGGLPADYKSTQNYLPVMLSVAWRTALGPRWMLWITAGGGMAWVANSAQWAGQPAVSESGVTGAASGSISAGPRVGPGTLFLEARVTWVADPNLSTLGGSSTNFLGLLGYRFDVR
jgi:hypothetical protein